MAYYDCLACHSFNTLLHFSSLFCTPLAWDILHPLGLWRASDVRKAIGEISLHVKTGLTVYGLKWVWMDTERLIRDVSSRVRSSTGRLK